MIYNQKQNNYTLRFITILCGFDFNNMSRKSLNYYNFVYLANIKTISSSYWSLIDSSSINWSNRSLIFFRIVLICSSSYSFFGIIWDTDSKFSKRSISYTYMSVCVFYSSNASFNTTLVYPFVLKIKKFLAYFFITFISTNNYSNCFLSVIYRVFNSYSTRFNIYWSVCSLMSDIVFCRSFLSFLYFNV